MKIWYTFLYLFTLCHGSAIYVLPSQRCVWSFHVGINCFTHVAVFVQIYGNKTFIATNGRRDMVKEKGLIRTYSCSPGGQAWRIVVSHSNQTTNGKANKIRPRREAVRFEIRQICNGGMAALDTRMGQRASFKGNPSGSKKLNRNALN